jgi:hypothetical protein
MATLTDEKTKVIKNGVPYNKHNAISSLQTKLFHKIKKTTIMSNFSILRPVNQQFIQYPYWIAQDNQFSDEEKGFLNHPCYPLFWNKRRTVSSISDTSILMRRMRSSNSPARSVSGSAGMSVRNILPLPVMTQFRFMPKLIMAVMIAGEKSALSLLSI